jgi:TonB family protein
MDGDFTRADEAEMEALTLADDFRREAWEGFRSLPEADHERHLMAIRAKLMPPERKPGFRFFGPSFLAIAAGLALLIGAVVFFNNRTQSGSLASEQKTPPTNMPAARSNGIQADSVPPWTSSDKMANTETAKRRSEAQPIGKAAGPSRQDSIAPADNIAFQSRQERAAPAPASPAAPPVSIPEVADEKTAWKADDQALKEVATTSPNQRYSQSNALPMKDSDAQGLSKTFFPGAAKAQDRAKKKSAKPDQKEELSKKAATGEPVNGWDDFHNYLVKNAKLTDEARSHSITGIVRLSFEVDRKGKPQNVKVINSLGYGLDEEAKRLVENTIWTQSPVLVDIPFGN